MKPIIVTVALILLFLLSLALSGCGVLTSLQIIVDATAAAVPVLEAAGVPIPPEVPLYVADVADCIGSQTGNPTSAQLTAIATCLASKVAPQLSGLPSAIVNIVAQITMDVQQYLLQHASANLQTATMPTKYSTRDIAKFVKMRTKAHQTAIACRAMVKK